NGHHPRVFQPAGDLRLLLKPASAMRIVCMALLDLLQRNFAVQFRILRHEDFAQSPFLMWPEDLIAKSSRLGGIGHARIPPRGIGIMAIARTKASQTGVQVRIVADQLLAEL